MQLWELCLAGKNLYCKLGFVKLQVRVLNYNVTGCARLIGIHLGAICPVEWGEISTKQSVGKCKQINF